MRLIIILLLILTLPFSPAGQTADEVLSRYFATELDGNVFMRWTITAGNTCEDTYIERSADGIAFERIGLIAGICGSPDASITFEFTDTVPVYNQVSYYRLMLGYFGYTTPLAIEVKKFNDEGFFAGPNPFRDFTRIAFRNDDNEEYRLLVCDMQGRKVLEMVTTGDKFIIRREELGSGIYIVKMIKENVTLNHFKLITE
ncbi:MAG: T9SS type A sorting domain-containing protein [Bacteroidales bacterium]|nr:T9SS type A sorting domain-containing protein [Bacteroidales bacterium]